MVNLNKDNKDCVLVAIDIAKKSHDAVIYFPTGKRLSMKFTNTLTGYQMLLERCQTDKYIVHVGFEPTTDYHRTIAFWFHRFLVLE